MVSDALLRPTTVMVVVLVALIVVPAAASVGRASRSFAGNVCSLFSAKQVAVVVNDSTATSKYKCVPSPSRKTPAGTTYAASSGTSTPSKGGFFSVQLVKYTNPTLESLVRNGYKKLTPVSGIGDWAYKRIGPGAVVGGTADLGELVFGAHGYGAVLTVRAALGKKVNQPALISLAKALAKQL